MKLMPFLKFSLSCLVFFSGLMSGLMVQDYYDKKEKKYPEDVAGYEWFQEESKEIEAMSAGVCSMDITKETYSVNRDNLGKRIARYNILACHKSSRQEWKGNCPYQYSLIEQISKYRKR